MSTLADWIKNLPMGADTPVLGVPPLTEDGHLIGVGAALWEVLQTRDGPQLGLSESIVTTDDEWTDYATRAAQCRRFFATELAANAALSEAAK